VRYELECVAAEPRAAAILARLAGLGLLRAAHPALRWDAAQAERAAVIPTLPLARWQISGRLDWLGVWLALLLLEAGPAEVEAALARLAVPTSAAEAVRRAGAVEVPGRPASRVAAALDGLSETVLVAAYVAQPAARAAIGDYLERGRHVRALTTGHDLAARGLTPGPAFGRILDQLRGAWLDGEVGDAAGEAALLDHLVAAEQAREGRA
jgi:tRNA nucleotidyltransferase (CCA-adding enzyme)